jgi:DNA polymerase III delta subunit
MLYVFYGSDITKSLEKAHKLVDSLRAKRPDASYVPVSGDDWNYATIEGHLGGQGLFSSKYIVFLDRVTENDEAKERIAELVPSMHESANIFVILEGKVNADLKKTFDKYAEKVIVSDLPAAGKAFGAKTDFNIFALADAFGNRDRFRSWNVYRQAVDRGIESESILGTLFWQVKSMILAATGKSAAECGLSPFVFTKAKKHAANFRPEELADLIRRLLVLYHEGHRGMVDMEYGIEKLLLEL